MKWRKVCSPIRIGVLSIWDLEVINQEWLCRFATDEGGFWEIDNKQIFC